MYEMPQHLICDCVSHLQYTNFFPKESLLYCTYISGFLKSFCLLSSPSKLNFKNPSPTLKIPVRENIHFVVVDLKGSICLIYLVSLCGEQI